MRKSLSLLLAGLLLLAMSGCGKPQPEDPAVHVKLELEETAYAIAGAAKFETTYNADASFLAKHYEFDESKVTGYKALFGTVLDTNRLILFEVPEDGQSEVAKAVAEKVKTQLQAAFGDDNPDQKAQAEAAQTVERGNYILFISGADAQAGADAFNKLFETETQAAD